MNDTTNSESPRLESLQYGFQTDHVADVDVVKASVNCETSGESRETGRTSQDFDADRTLDEFRYGKSELNLNMTTRLPQSCNRRFGRSRQGFTLAEMLVAVAIMVGIMSFVTTFCFQINQLWKSVGHHRMASCELSNQLERLTLLSGDQIEAELKNLEPSEACQRTLKEAILTGEIIQDAIGDRIVLRINWKRNNPGSPVELSGWIVDGEEEE
jgi:prepilin-type N-terminal cleavage/methylation domain-containing protein